MGTTSVKRRGWGWEESAHRWRRRQGRLLTSGRCRRNSRRGRRTGKRRGSGAQARGVQDGQARRYRYQVRRVGNLHVPRSNNLQGISLAAAEVHAKTAAICLCLFFSN
ncbi:hypothetical protein VPH35_002047 [Triticum aestivum]